MEALAQRRLRQISDGGILYRIFWPGIFLFRSFVWIVFLCAIFVGSIDFCRPTWALASSDAVIRPQPEQSSEIQKWCEEVRASVSHLKWNLEPCNGIQWQVGGKSVQGRPLVYVEFGDPNSDNTTLIFSTVHGDEITPLYLGVQLVHWIQERQSQLSKIHVVIAPLVNPDGFFKVPRTRMNARGVDLNRNFATRDWRLHALKSWKSRYRKDPRRFPGNEPSSEPETQFQSDLIRKIQPQKILSIHSPLNFLDYDGPSSLALSRFPNDYAEVCDQLRKRMKAISGGYFPGSLGNYAGRELGIPTLTLELPSADPRKAEAYWKKFSQGIRTMIQFSVPNYATGAFPKPASKPEG